MIKFRQFIYPKDKGRDVKAVKHALWRRGHHNIAWKNNAAGGAYVNALKTFQKNHKLKPDGIYGPATHDQLAPTFTLYEKWLYRTSRIRDKARVMRDKLCTWAHWGVVHQPSIHYSEGADRSEWLNRPPGTLPMTTDCSGFVTACYKWSGLPDPNGLGYRELGYTGTLLQRAKVITDRLDTAKPGDLIVYGPGTGAHVVMVVQAGSNPLCVSHGQEGDPNYIHALDDPRLPRRVCKYL